MKYLKELALYYILFLFIILKSSYLTGQPAYLKEDDFNFTKKKLSYIKKLSF